MSHRIIFPVTQTQRGRAPRALKDPVGSDHHRAETMLSDEVLTGLTEQKATVGTDMQHGAPKGVPPTVGEQREGTPTSPAFIYSGHQNSSVTLNSNYNRTPVYKLQVYTL